MNYVSLFSFFGAIIYVYFFQQQQSGQYFKFFLQISFTVPVFVSEYYVCGCERLCNISSIFTANAKVVLKSQFFPDIQNLKHDLKCPFICDKTPKSKYSYIQKRSLNQISSSNLKTSIYFYARSQISMTLTILIKGSLVETAVQCSFT